MKNKLKEVEFLDYIGSRKEPYKHPSVPADSAYIADQGMTGTLAEATKPVAEEISKVLEYITGFFQWDTYSTVDNETLTQYRKRPDYLRNEKHFNTLLDGWSLNGDETVGLKALDVKDFNEQELKDLAIDIDNFIKSADIPMIMSDTLQEDMTTAAIAVPEGGMTVSPIKKKQDLGYTSLNENEYPKEVIKSFYDRPDAEQILDEFRKIAQEYKLNIGTGERISSQLAKRNPVFQKEIISKFDDLAKKYNLTLQNLGLQEAKGKCIKEENTNSLHVLNVRLGKDSGFAFGAIGRNLIITLSDGSKVESDDEDLLDRYKELRKGGRKDIEQLNNFLYRKKWDMLNENEFNRAEIETQDKQDFNQSEWDRLFLTQLLSSYKSKFPSSLQTKLENLFYTHNITNINDINLDIFSDSFIKTIRNKVEELIKQSGLNADMFESKEVKAKKIVESYGLIEKEEEEVEEKEEKIYSFKSKNRVIVVKGFEETEARDIAVKIMAPNDSLPELPEGQYELSYILPGEEEELTEGVEDSLKRYIVSFDIYMYAKDDNAIKKAAEAFARKLDLEYDNKASVLEIHENPFGSMNSRKV